MPLIHFNVNLRKLLIAHKTSSEMLVIYQVLNLSITLYTERTSRIIWRRSVMRFLQSYQNMLIGKMLDSAVGLQHPSPNCCFSTSVCVSLLEGTACVSRRRTRSRYGWAESKLHLRMPPSNRSAIMCRLKTFTLEPHSAPPLSCLSTVLQTGAVSAAVWDAHVTLHTWQRLPI